MWEHFITKAIESQMEVLGMNSEEVNFRLKNPNGKEEIELSM